MEDYREVFNSRKFEYLFFWYLGFLEVNLKDQYVEKKAD